MQEWGEEFEDGAVYGVTLLREPVPSSPDPSEESACCAFVQYRTCKVRRLKAATLELLVNHLLGPGTQEQDYSRIFLSTYRTFTGTSKLIELLFQRYITLLVFVENTLAESEIKRLKAIVCSGVSIVLGLGV